VRCFAARCFAATQQAPEPGFGALLRVALLRVALQQAPEPGSGALLRLALLRLVPELYCALFCCGSGALLRVALLWLQSFDARCFAATKPCNAASSGASLAAEEKEEP